MPTMSTIDDKPGAGWNRINTDDYFKNYVKMSETGDVESKKNLQHHMLIYWHGDEELI